MKKETLAIFNPATPNSFKQTNATLYSVYNILFWSECALLVVFFSAALFHVVRQKKQPFAAKLLALLLLSNVSLVVCMLLFRLVLNYINTGQQLDAFWWSLAIIAYTCFVVSDACFNVATWCLAFNYFMCSEKLEQVHTQNATSKPPANEKCFNVVFWIMLTLNICSSVAWGTFRFIHNYDKYTGQYYSLADAEFAAQVSDGVL